MIKGLIKLLYLRFVCLNRVLKRPVSCKSYLDLILQITDNKFAVLICLRYLLFLVLFFGVYENGIMKQKNWILAAFI